MNKLIPVFYGVTEEESNYHYIEYPYSEKYAGKNINLDLKGLREFVKDSNLQNVIKYYFITDLSNFEVMNNIYKDHKYNMITVKIPFKIKIDKVYKLFEEKT